MTDDMQKQLILAVNLLSEYVENHLVPGWTIALEMSSEDVDLRLFNPDGEECDIDISDYGWSSVASACDIARDMGNSKEDVGE